MKNKNVIVLAVFLILVSGLIFSQLRDSHKSSSSTPQSAGRSMPTNSAAFFSPNKLRGSEKSVAASGNSSSPSNVTGTSQTSGPVPDINGGGVAKVLANFKVGDHAYRLEPSQYGAFPRVPVAAGQKISVSLKFPYGDAGETVAVQTIDGGILENQKAVEQTKLDDQLSANFTFHAGTQEGIYRVAVSERGQIETIQFWVGSLPKMRSVAQ